MEPSDLDSSLVNCMCWSIELRCCRNSSVLVDFKMVRVSSTNLLQKDGGFWAVCMALVSRSSIYRLATNGLMGDPMAVPSFSFSLEEAHSSERKLDLSLKIYFCY